MHPYISYAQDSFKVMNSKNEDITENMDIYWAKGNDRDYKKEWNFEKDGNPVRFKIMGRRKPY